MSRFSWILFDLGGVVVDWDGSAVTALTDGRLTAEDARRFWLESQSIKRFQSGKCRADEFARGVIDELGLKVSPEEFLELFRGWDRGSLPGAHEMLKELRKQFPLACLSNTNALHWQMHREHGLVDLFNRCFPSFEIGLGKPDPAAFKYVVEQLGVAPEEILFFDDSPECVHAAEKVGMVARQVNGVEGVKQVLREYGVII